MLTTLSKETLHHAYILEGKKDIILPLLEEKLASFGVVLRGNPDYHVRDLSAMLLDDAHELIVRQSRFGTDGGKKIFVIMADTIGHEAQNALLKTLEEPKSNTHFFFIIPSAASLLPTVRSRMVHLRSRDHIPAERPFAHEVGAFLAGGIVARMEIVAPWVKEKDRVSARMFLDTLTEVYHERYTLLDPDVLETLQRAKRHLFGRSPSVKMILEHCALTFPLLEK